MSQLERIGVSLERQLLAKFDRLIAGQGYQSRSEAIRDLIRGQLSHARLENPKAEAVAAVCLVYNHHQAELMKKLTHLQHTHLLQTISTLHVHLDKQDCLEVVVLKGQVGQIKKVGEQLVSQKGVKLGKINVVATEQE